jgi:hypothetical protein
MSYDPDYPSDTRLALTPWMKNKIKDAVNNKCERCSVYGKELLEIHHIEAVYKADGSYDLNNPSNLIVLCRNCHVKATRGLLNPAELHDIVYKRVDHVKVELNDVLKDRYRVENSRKDDKTYPNNDTVISTPSSQDYKYVGSSYSSDWTDILFNRETFGVVFASLMFTIIGYVVFSNWLGNGYKSWLVNTINPTGLSATITEIILALVMILIFTIISIAVSIAIRTTIKKLVYMGKLDILFNNTQLYNFIAKGSSFIVTMSIIIFALSALLAWGVLSYQVHAGDGGLLQNFLFNTTYSLLDISINILSFIMTVLTIFIVSVIISLFAIGAAAQNRY